MSEEVVDCSRGDTCIGGWLVDDVVLVPVVGGNEEELPLVVPLALVSLGTASSGNNKPQNKKIYNI